MRLNSVKRSLAMSGLVAGVVGANGCATILNGTTQTIPVSSIPSGARVIADGSQVCVTPCSVELARKHDHLLVFEKRGYENVSVGIKHSLGGAVAGNILLGGFIGWGIDAASGSQYKLTPSTVNVVLERDRYDGRGDN